MAIARAAHDSWVNPVCVETSPFSVISGSAFPTLLVIYPVEDRYFKPVWYVAAAYARSNIDHLIGSLMSDFSTLVPPECRYVIWSAVRLAKRSLNKLDFCQEVLVDGVFFLFPFTSLYLQSRIPLSPVIGVHRNTYQTGSIRPTAMWRKQG